MAEGLGGFSNIPTAQLVNVYSQWAKGNWGSVLTGSRLCDQHGGRSLIHIQLGK